MSPVVAALRRMTTEDIIVAFLALAAVPLPIIILAVLL